MSAGCQTHEGQSPERITKVNANAEVAAGLLHAVHANLQLPSITATCCKCEDGKELQKHKEKSITCSSKKDTTSNIKWTLWEENNQFSSNTLTKASVQGWADEQAHPDELEEVAEEREFWAPLRVLPPRPNPPSSRKWMDGWVTLTFSFSAR